MPKSFDPPEGSAAAQISKDLDSDRPPRRMDEHIKDQLAELAKLYQKVPDVVVISTVGPPLGSSYEEFAKTDPVHQLARVVEGIEILFPLPLELSVDVSIDAGASPEHRVPRLHIMVGPVPARESHKPRGRGGAPLPSFLSQEVTRIDFVTAYDANARAIAAGAAAGDFQTPRALDRIPTDDQCLAWVAACVDRAVLHELAEGFYVKGRRVFDPHGGPDGIPFMIGTKDDVTRRGGF